MNNIMKHYNINETDFKLIFKSYKHQLYWISENIVFRNSVPWRSEYVDFIREGLPYTDEFDSYNYRTGFRYQTPHTASSSKSDSLKTSRKKLKTHVPIKTRLDWSILNDEEFMKISFDQGSFSKTIESPCPGSMTISHSPAGTQKFISARSNSMRNRPREHVATRTFHNSNTANRITPPTTVAINEGASTSQIPEIKVNYTDQDISEPEVSDTTSSIGSIPDMTDFSKEVFALLPGLQDSEPLITEQIHHVIEAAIDNGIMPSLGSERAFLISVMVSTVTSIGTSITTFYTTPLTTNMKALHIANLSTQLVTFAFTLHSAFKKIKVEYAIKEVRNMCPQLANLILGEVKSNNDSWIYTAISSIVSIIIGGLTTFKLIDVKSIIDGGRWLQSLKSYQTAGKDAATILFEDLLNLDIKGDTRTFELISKLAKRTSELKSYSYYHYLSNPPLLNELKELTTKVIDTTMKSLQNTTLSKAMSGQRMILQNHDSLLDTHKMLQSILETRKRQECVGILLAGQPNVGKSHLTSYIAKKVASILDYQSGIYSIDKSCKGEYFQPYGLQDIGVQEEFMAQRSNDETLSYINKIISGDPYNLEGAALELKQQPCRLKLVMLTANQICPVLTGVLGSTYAEGVWDRILRIEVSDPQLVGRGQQAPHRKPDFSHLKFRIVTNARELNSSNLRYAELTINQLINMIIARLIRAELNYI
jgi:hypothetical protein